MYDTDSYAQATVRVQKLNTEQYAFTTDGEDDKAKEKKILVALKKRNNNTFLQQILNGEDHSKKDVANQPSDQLIDTENDSDQYETQTESDCSPSPAKKPKKPTKKNEKRA